MIAEQPTYSPLPIHEVLQAVSRCQSHPRQGCLHPSYVCPAQFGFLDPCPWYLLPGYQLSCVSSQAVKPSKLSKAGSRHGFGALGLVRAPGLGLRDTSFAGDPGDQLPRGRDLPAFAGFTHRVWTVRFGDSANEGQVLPESPSDWLSWTSSLSRVMEMG